MKKAIILLLSVFAWVSAQDQDLSDLRFLNLSNSRVYIILGADGLKGLYVHPYGVGRFPEVSKAELIDGGYAVLLIDKGLAVTVGSNDNVSKELENGDMLLLDDKVGVCQLSYIPLSTLQQQRANLAEINDSNSMSSDNVEIMGARIFFVR